MRHDDRSLPRKYYTGDFNVISRIETYFTITLKYYFHIQNCRGNFVGHNCENCKHGYYLVGNECRKCACPSLNTSNNFSPTCHSESYSGIEDYTCDACEVGYEGKHCEM